MQVDTNLSCGKEYQGYHGVNLSSGPCRLYSQYILGVLMSEKHGRVNLDYPSMNPFFKLRGTIAALSALSLSLSARWIFYDTCHFKINTYQMVIRCL